MGKITFDVYDDLMGYCVAKGFKTSLEAVKWIDMQDNENLRVCKGVAK